MSHLGGVLSIAGLRVVGILSGAFLYITQCTDNEGDVRYAEFVRELL